jgi:hypothetical protein
LVEFAVAITTSSPEIGMPPSQFTGVLHLVSITPRQVRVAANAGAAARNARRRAVERGLTWLV